MNTNILFNTIYPNLKIPIGDGGEKKVSGKAGDLPGVFGVSRKTVDLWIESGLPDLCGTGVYFYAACLMWLLENYKAKPDKSGGNETPDPIQQQVEDVTLRLGKKLQGNGHPS